MSTKNRLILSIVGIVVLIAVGVLYWLNATGRISIFADVDTTNKYQIIFSPDAYAGGKWDFEVLFKGSVGPKQTYISVPFASSTLPESKWNLTTKDNCKTLPSTSNVWTYISCSPAAYENTGQGYMKLQLSFDVPLNTKVKKYSWSNNFVLMATGVSKNITASPTVNVAASAFDLLKPLSSNNKIENDRANIIFYGTGYSNSAEFYNRMKQNIETGILSVSPFSENKDKFNFWYDENVRTANSAYFDGLSNRNYSLCGDVGFEQNIPLSNKYNVFACKFSLMAASSVGTGGSLLGGPLYYGDDMKDSTKPNNYFFPYILRHEFGHAFGWLRDEYSGGSAGNQSGYPNCASSVAQAQSWWGDMAGKGDGNYKVDNVGTNTGCSYVSTNIRPNKNTIMNIPIFTPELSKFGPVNEAYLTHLIQKITNNVISKQSVYSFSLYKNGSDISNTNVNKLDTYFSDEKVDTESSHQPVNLYKVELSSGDNSILYSTQVKFSYGFGALSNITKVKKDILIPFNTSAKYIKVYKMGSSSSTAKNMPSNLKPALTIDVSSVK